MLLFQYASIGVSICCNVSNFLFLLRCVLLLNRLRCGLLNVMSKCGVHFSDAVYNLSGLLYILHSYTSIHRPGIKFVSPYEVQVISCNGPMCICYVVLHVVASVIVVIFAYIVTLVICVYLQLVLCLIMLKTLWFECTQLAYARL